MKLSHRIIAEVERKEEAVGAEVEEVDSISRLILNPTSHVIKE